MPFISGILTNLLKWVMEKGYRFIIPLISMFIRNYKDRQKNAADAKALEKAKTKEELESAANKVIDNF